MIHLADGKLGGLRTRSLNEQELNPVHRDKRVKRERGRAHMAAVIAMPPRDWTHARLAQPGRYVVILTRVAPNRAKPLDGHDNLPGALKHVVDGICDRLGIDDGDTARIRFEYRQEVGPWAVLFTVALEQLVPATTRAAQNSGGSAPQNKPETGGSP